MQFQVWLDAIQLNLYHGSRKKFPPGFKLSPQLGYVQDPGQQKLELLFEKYKPANKISRKQAVFLVDDPEMCENAGGYSDYVYLVQPEGKVEKSDLAWYTECEMYFDEPLEKKIECIKNYWNGVPYYNQSNSLFEYRCRSAIVIKEI
jgi:hypothetical protein